MGKLDLKYGCNPNQGQASISVDEGRLPVKVLNGRPGYINLLDALNGWQLVRELKSATGLAAATSFKHVSPAGAAVALELDETERKMYFVSQKASLSPIATAYVRARGADRMSSFGDFIALSDECDLSCAKMVNREVSDGIIAPGYTEEALALLKAKRKGSYCILEIDRDYRPSGLETRTVFGVTFTQEHNSFIPTAKDFDNIVTTNQNLPEWARRDLTVALVALKYTQSNSVCYASRGQTIGVGAGQQSRIHCTRLAGNKADLWLLRHHEKVLSLPFVEGLSRNDKDNVIEQYLADEREEDVVGDWERWFKERPDELTKEDKRAWLDSMRGVSLASDAFFPFRDNIDRAARSGVSFVCEPGGSLRDEDVIRAADEHGMTMVFNGVRLFHH